MNEQKTSRSAPEPEQDKKKRLSSALRENLKRRKAAPRPKKADEAKN